MEDLKQDIEILSGNTRQLVQSEITLVKLQAVEAVSSYASTIFSRFLFSVLGLLSFGLILFGFGYFMADLLDNLWLGFFAAAGVSTAISLVFFWMRKPLVEHPVQNHVIEDLTKRMNI